MYISTHSEKFTMRNNKCFYMLGLMLYFLSCYTTPSKGLSSDSGIRYSDINLFTLTGIGKMDQVHYPCISIDSINKSKIIITFCYSDKLQDTVMYRFNGNHWSTNYSFLADTAIMRIVTNIYDDRIIWFRYFGDDSVSKMLSSFNIF